MADLNPVYWNFWVGLLLVLFVLFARGGLIGGARPDGRPGTARRRAHGVNEPTAHRALATDELCKNFGALRGRLDIDFRAAVRLRHALIGPNGSGKTTLINLLGGALRRPRGRSCSRARDDHARSSRTGG